MCGIAGILHWGDERDAVTRASTMALAMRHRGPDDLDVWSDDDIALGFVRLSIVDIDGGAQPMHSADGRITVVYNGEIYNHRELRLELERRGHRFQSDHSDTEVLVHGYLEWGESLVERLNGMFAFAVWDSVEKHLYLARDRFGIKPLYLARFGAKGLMFCSEIRPLLASGLIESKPNAAALVEYLSFQNYYGSDTVFAGVHAFPSANFLSVSRAAERFRKYWHIAFDRDRSCDFSELVAEHQELLESAVRSQLQADVPVMSYLSGGIDSSAIAAWATRESPGIRSYACLFDLTDVGEDRDNDEREFSRAMAKHLSTRHSEIELDSHVLTGCLDQVIGSLEEPRMGMSYVNYLIAQRVATDGKVVLSGMGGDELHGGYLYRLQALAQHRPGAGVFAGGMRLALRAGVRRALRGSRRNQARATLMGLLNFPLKANELRDALGPVLAPYIEAFDVRQQVQQVLDECPSDDPWDELMLMDARVYLHGLLVLEDKLSMAHSLETRVPLLDNNLIDFMLGVPWGALCDNSTGKILFRESTRGMLPAVVANKPKMGFGPPDASWYRGPLREWLSAELAPSTVEAAGLFKASFVERVLTEHFENKRNHVALIWSLLSLHSWGRVFGFYDREGRRK